MSPNELAPSQDSGTNIIEQVIAKGDLAKLSPQERVAYYRHVCQSVGLNPFTRPFEYIMLSGKLTLYARRDAADQLRKINGISVEVVSRKVENDLVVVHVKARDKSGRTDEDFGAVTIVGLRGENLANAQMKAITKAKRRVTLSISGLGFLDEPEVDEYAVTDKAPAPISAAADLDDFAEMPSPQLVQPELSPGMPQTPVYGNANSWGTNGPPHSGTPFDLPPHPSERTNEPGEPQLSSRSGPPTPRRAALWRKSSYALQPEKLLDGSDAWNQWALDLVRFIAEATTEAELNKLASDNKERLGTLEELHAEARQRITDAAVRRRAKLREEAATP